MEPAEIKQQEQKIHENLLDFRRKGAARISISGSDPIEYKKIIPLIKRIKEQGFEFVKLSTHGRRLSDKRFLEEFVGSGIDQVRIPLYGSTAKVHDSVTCSEGSFDETLKGIQGLLEKPQIQVQVSSLIARQNKGDLLNLIDLVSGMGIKDFYFSIPCIIKNGDYSSFYIPIKDLAPIVREAYHYALEKKFDLHFWEIPFCVFGLIDRERINNTTSPPDLGKHCQPPERHRTNVKDLPSYRLKTKPEMCSGCECFGFCNGFFLNDFSVFGNGNLKPIARQAGKPA